jgi:hypothetical protein
MTDADDSIALVAGEPVDVLAEAVLQIHDAMIFTGDGRCTINCRLAPRLAVPFQRAFRRVDAELLRHDEWVSEPGVQIRTDAQRRVDVLLALMLRVADAGFQGDLGGAK